MTGAQLVILAAGMGRRFGGLKQLVPVGPGGAAIMDYTVFDALRAGFTEIVLVIRQEIEDEVRAHVEKGFGRRVSVRYVHQDPEGRGKPWGTGQAVLSAGSVLQGPFAVANADDFYGSGALAGIGNALVAPAQEHPDWALAGYRILETLPARGAVSRGLLRVHDGWLDAIEEVHTVERGPEGATRDRSGQRHPLPAETLVSMNLWGFDLDVLDHLARDFAEFRSGAPGADQEFYLPESVGRAVRQGVARVRVLPTDSRWCGITSAGDLAEARRFLADLTSEGSYPDTPRW